MPTADRAAFVPFAVASFLSQTWKEKELIVVDDGAESVWPLVAHVPGVVYLRYPHKMTIGRKRNIAIEHAAGDVIAHFDDDDWSAPTRLADQVDRLAQSGKSATGYRWLLFWDWVAKRAFEFRYDNDNYVCGTSLMFRKDYWSANRFADVMTGEDSQFAYRASAQGELAAVRGTRLMVASIHQRNTSQSYGARGSTNWPQVDSAEVPPAFFTATGTA